MSGDKWRAAVDTDEDGVPDPDNNNDGITDERREGGPGELILGQGAIEAYVAANYDRDKFEIEYGPSARLPVELTDVDVFMSPAEANPRIPRDARQLAERLRSLAERRREREKAQRNDRAKGTHPSRFTGCRTRQHGCSPLFLS